MTFGEKIQLLRKQKGLSQEKLSEQLEVSRQAISKWELGESLPDTENVVRLSKLFNVSIDYLLNDEINIEDDMSVVQKNTDNFKNKFHPAMQFILGLACSAVGFVGSISLFVLSTMIQVHVTKKRIMPDGSVQHYGGGNVLGYNFIRFIQEYRLQAILAISVILIITGVVIIWKSKIKPNS